MFLTVLVTLGALTRVDRAVLGITQVPHASWLDVTASLITLFGQTEVVGTIAIGVAIVRLRNRRRDWWVPLLLALVVGAELVFKLTVPQAPPPLSLSRSIPLLPFIEAPTMYSFPSGHVARLAFLVGALRWPAGLSATLILVVAITRVYLAEHWPSDVVGGWLLGAGVAALAYRRQ